MKKRITIVVIVVFLTGIAFLLFHKSNKPTSESYPAEPRKSTKTKSAFDIKYKNFTDSFLL